MDKKNRKPKRMFTWGQCLKYDVDTTGQFIKKVYNLPKSCIDSERKGSPIQEFFSGAHVLVTGSTGFMGKAIVEKLLASCPKSAKVYLLIREKKGKGLEKRLDDLFADDIFVRVRDTVPDFRNKVVGVNGDCSELSLGLSDTDYTELSKKVNVIIHGAATVNFHEKLRVSTLINVRGVREMVRFASKCTNIKSIVHISTAYSNAVLERSVIEEKFYPASVNYKELIDIVESNTEQEIEKMEPEIIKGWPNTYSFTKLVAEGIIEQECQNLPLAVFRPGIVAPSYKEPVRGWCDNLSGVTGAVTGAWTGVLRICPVAYDAVGNMVPVDTAVNSVLAIAYQTTQSFGKEERQVICNYVSTERNPLTWAEMHRWSFKYGRNWPTMNMVWYPKPITTLWQILSAEDKEIFPFDIADVDWDMYCFTYLLGVRTYLLKDPLETIPAAKIKYQRLVVQHAATVGIISLSAMWVAYHIIALGLRFFFLMLKLL